MPEPGSSGVRAPGNTPLRSTRSESYVCHPFMPAPSDRIMALDITVFDTVPSQTRPGERRSLLALQRAIARKHDPYVYLEIGSYLGGSLQPHVLDPRCARIHSIDPRPDVAADDRAPGFQKVFSGNTTARMLENLARVDADAARRITTYESNAKAIDPRRIGERPHLAFIDGEHTREAVLGDFDFCAGVVRPGGIIAFHDFYIVAPAVMEICARLEREGREHLAARLEGSVFAIFLDPSLATGDEYLRDTIASNAAWWKSFRRRHRLKQLVPKPVRDLVRRIRG